MSARERERERESTEEFFLNIVEHKEQKGGYDDVRKSHDDSQVFFGRACSPCSVRICTFVAAKQANCVPVLLARRTSSSRPHALVA
jgi:hypothetical protein